MEAEIFYRNFSPLFKQNRNDKFLLDRLSDLMPYNAKICSCVESKMSSFKGSIRAQSLQGTFYIEDEAPSVGELYNKMISKISLQIASWLNNRYSYKAPKEAWLKKWYAEEMEGKKCTFCVQAKCPFLETKGHWPGCL